MPVCKKCGDSFPSRIEVEGVKRILTNRKHCLVCNPFGLQNTKKLLNEKTLVKNQQIYVWMKTNREVRKLELIELLGGKCRLCGYSKFPGSLHFHHVNKNDKDFALSKANLCRKNKEAISQEVLKTVLLCSNCHGEVHGGLWKEEEKVWLDEVTKV